MRRIVLTVSVVVVGFLLGRVSAQDVEPSCEMCPSTYISAEEIQRYTAVGRGVGARMRAGLRASTVEPVTYRCGTRRVCQARSSGSERDTRARPHAVAPMNGASVIKCCYVTLRRACT